MINPLSSKTNKSYMSRSIKIERFISVSIKLRDSFDAQKESVDNDTRISMENDFQTFVYLINTVVTENDGIS